MANHSPTADQYRQTVYLVDDDSSVRKALTRLLTSAGLEVTTYSSATDFLASEHADHPTCLLLDIEMPGLSGLELQEELRKQDLDPPIVFLTGHGTVKRSVRAMKQGAIDFLQKPFDDEELFTVVRQALAKDARRRRLRAETALIRRRYARLTPRECEVFELVVTGLLNKQIAGRLGTSEKTVKVHRGRVMRKMEAESLADLVRMSERLSTLPAAM